MGMSTGRFFPGQFVPGHSSLHNLEPRVKIILFLVLVVLPLASENRLILITQSGLQALAFIAARLPLLELWRSLRLVIGLLAITAVVLVFSTPGVAAYSLGPFEPTNEGVNLAVNSTLRALLLMGAGLLLITTTSPIAFTDGLESLMRPMRRFGVPVSELALMTTVAIRFVPILLEEAERIRKAQEARGAKLAGGGMARLFKHISYLVVILFKGALRRAEELAVAMDARGYRPGVGRVPSREYAVGLREGVAVAVVFLPIALAIMNGWSG